MTQFVLSICKSCPIQLNLPYKARNTDKVIAVIIIRMFVFLLIKWYLTDNYFDWENLVNRKPHSMYLCMKDVSFVAWWTGLSGLSQASAASITTLWCSSLIVCHLVYVYNLSLFSLLLQVRLFCCLLFWLYLIKGLNYFSITLRHWVKVVIPGSFNTDKLTV